MNSRLQFWLFRLLGREARVPLSACVHFCGYRYGRAEFNPYENYVTARVQGASEAEARERLVQFLLYYRPRHFGEALGLDLRRRYPLWYYPWSWRSVPDGWRAEPDDCPDILTHFSERGISARGLAAECQWLEDSLRSIRANGYRPDRFRSTIRARRLVREDGCVAYLLLDGNHRVSALSALGYKEACVRYLPVATVRAAAAARWPQVRNGTYIETDAACVFAVYFDGNRCSRTTDAPSSIVPA